MSKYKYFVISVIALALVGGGVFWYVNSLPKKGTFDSDDFAREREFRPTIPALFEDDEEKPEWYSEDAVIELGTKEFKGGGFEKIENGRIYYWKNGGPVSQSLTDELVLACVKQDLTNASSIDLNLVAEVLFLSPSEMQAILQPGEPIVVNATEVDGVYKVHTINVSSAVCDQL